MQADQQDKSTLRATESGNNVMLIIVVIMLAVVATGGYYYLNQTSEPILEPVVEPVVVPEVLPEQPLPTENIPEPQPEPIIEPISEPEVIEQSKAAVVEPKSEPLPSLEQSDGFLVKKTKDAFKRISIDNILKKDNVARQFVVFVDHIARGDVARKASPLVAPEQQFDVLEVSEKTYLNPDSYHRYDIYAGLLEQMSATAIIDTYTKLMPLLEDAFAELGYEDVSFNQRVRKAIREVMNAPVIEQPIELTSVSVNYKFKDDKLEALPNAQKLMIRMGPDNTRKIKLALKKVYNQLPK
ncbi:DUF3014 domain-containing protein [Parashewanella spongiae]|uniref:DUF3014 domain-containing protein n=1 Tax=Parashewanella spongiae TaxID=342950 RepID=A0A3A6TFG6_9GAMM|nr:DUF3014 domain-containing protein [Parashewanella spongiae]MCL1078819.1 DUF3014 domain-containing protein [Parashewanella spongiae]RJY11902.1 DUF3014 domain-containing protein [Parashewanella spongiae]